MPVFMPVLSFFRAHALKLVDALVVLVSASLVASVLGIAFLLSPNLPTGGDSASHLLYLWVYAHELLPQGHVTAWMPEVFGGLAFLSYYFPLAFMAIVGLSKLMAFGPAMKLGMFAAAMLLPGAVWVGSVHVLKLPRRIALWGTLASLAFLLHEQNSIWGGNLLSTLAGEFTQSYGVLFSVLTLFAWQRCIATGRGWYWVALLEAATGFSNGFALLITGFATSAFLFDRAQVWRNFKLLLFGHSLAFFMLAGWLWPMLQMHSITIPNDALFEVQSWHDLLPFPVACVLGAGWVGVLGHGLLQVTPWLRQHAPLDDTASSSLRHAGFMACAALLSATGFLAGSAIGVANIRFFPFVWLLGGLACGWVWGSLWWRIEHALPKVLNTGWWLLRASAVCAFLVALSLNMTLVMDWGLWNHSGLESKPQWQQLTRLFPALSGQLDSPRLLFEHDPANNDIGSTRALEALPMFLGSRPVLEGLYMESALVSPAIYQLQSEVSRHPSSPLARFPSSSFDLERAAQHMRFLWSNQVLVRHEESRQAFMASKDFALVASASPFHVFELKHFDTHWVDLVDRPLQWHAKKDWMETSFHWFSSRQLFGQLLPVFSDSAPPTHIQAPPAQAQISQLRMSRDSLQWHTNAVGSAHLVRVAWHPRWQLASKGQIYLAGPGFMLVVPEENEVRLVYTDTTVGTLGLLSSCLAFLVFAVALWRRTVHGPATQASPAVPWPQDTRWNSWVWMWPLVLVAAGTYFHVNNPERVYTAAWVEMRANRWPQAMEKFDQAYAGRKTKAKKEEALFWSAKAREQAQLDAQALSRYGELTSQFQGYWLPESLFTQAALAQKLGDTAQATALRERLVREFPNDRWTQKISPNHKP